MIEINNQNDMIISSHNANEIIEIDCKNNCILLSGQKLSGYLNLENLRLSYKDISYANISTSLLTGEKNYNLLS